MNILKMKNAAVTRFFIAVLFLAGFILTGCDQDAPPKACGPVPSKNQMKWNIMPLSISH
jgi:hypothetical protein